jgi:tetratricopeptide (TPR) repeat protein
VVLNDGAKPEGIAVQRFCGLNVTGEGFTDSSGHFTIQRVSNSGFGGDGGASDSAQGNCELRASLAGYRSDTLPLSTRHSNESNDAGVIVLRRVSAAYGLTVSATMLLAPKEARKSYDKGLEAIRRDHPDDAQKDFGDAVQIYPRFAGAWFELGKVYEQRNHLAQARGAYNSAIAADAGYLYPYERLYRLDIRESKWKEAAETSGKVLRLDPYEFPEAFYFNAVSNFELQNLDAAERSAREAAKLEGEQAEPRSNYILGVILWRKGDLDAAVEKIRTFLSSPHEGPEWKSAQRMLTDIQRQIGQRRLRSDCSEECAASDED